MRDWIFASSQRYVRCEREARSFFACPEETCEKIASSRLGQVGTRLRTGDTLQHEQRTTVPLFIAQTHTPAVFDQDALVQVRLSSCRRLRPCRPSGASSRATRPGRRRHSRIRLRSSPSSSTRPVSTETPEQQPTMNPPHSKGSTTLQPNFKELTPIASQVSPPGANLMCHPAPPCDEHRVAALSGVFVQIDRSADSGRRTHRPSIGKFRALLGILKKTISVKDLSSVRISLPVRSRSGGCALIERTCLISGPTHICSDMHAGHHDGTDREPRTLDVHRPTRLLCGFGG
mgnify:CR=1 FL=1|jgi:hypothetical protein